MNPYDQSRDDFAGTWHEEETPEQARLRYHNRQLWEQSVLAAVSVGVLTPQQAFDKGLLSVKETKEFQLLPSTLYHVTTAASAVRAHGLKSRFELGRESGSGLGGGDDLSISLTTDEKAAKNIYESILIACRVARGELTIDEMVATAEAGAGAKHPWLESVVKHFTPKGYEDIRQGLKNGQPMTPEQRREAAFEFFKYWSSYRESAGGMAYPLFYMNDVGALTKLNESDIAILKFAPVAGAMGVRKGSLGEWVTYSGKALRLVGGKTAAVPDDVNTPAKAMSPQYDAVRVVLRWFQDNNVSFMTWKDFQKHFQAYANRYPQLFTDIRGNRPRISRHDLENFLNEYQGESNYGVSTTTYQDAETSFRDVEQLVLQLNQGADAAHIIGEDPVLTDYLDMLSKASQQSGHPMNANTVGWLRVDFINEEWLLIDEVQSDLVNSVVQAKNIVSIPTYEEFIESYQNEHIRQQIVQRVPPHFYPMMRQEFMRRGYTLEKLEEIKAQLTTLFKDWAEHALATVIEIARRHEIKNVAIHSVDSIAQRDPSVDALKVKMYYDNLAKSFGFTKQDVPELNGKFWVRKTASESDPYVYHVTPQSNVDDVLRDGLKQEKGYQLFNDIPKAINFTEAEGLDFWKKEVSDYYETPVAVVRVPKTELNLLPDEFGTEDAGAKAYRVEQDVPASVIQKISATTKADWNALIAEFWKGYGGEVKDKYNQCKHVAMALAGFLLQKGIPCKIKRVEIFQGKGYTKADPRWFEGGMTPYWWMHYVVVVGGTVLDLTGTQFGKERRTIYPESVLEKEWDEVRDVTGMYPPSMLFGYYPKQSSVKFPVLPFDKLIEEHGGLEQFNDALMHDIKDPEKLRGYLSQRYQAILRQWQQFKFPLTVYRSLYLNDISELDISGLGTYWAFAEAGALAVQQNPNGGDEPYYENDKGKKVFILRAEVKRSDIDWADTLYANLMAGSGEVEQEITVYEGSSLRITGWKLRNGEWQVALPEWKKAKASVADKTDAAKKSSALYIEVPKSERDHFWQDKSAPLEFWAFKDRPRVLIGEKIVFSFDKKPVAQATVHHTEEPGASKCTTTGKYEDRYKVFWDTKSFRKYKTAAMAIRRGEIQPNGAYFSLPGQSTYHDNDAVERGEAKEYDLSSLNIADTSNREVAEAVIKEAIRAAKGMMKLSLVDLLRETEKASPVITYMDNDALPLPEAAKRLGYDGIQVWENDDITHPSSVFVWNVDKIPQK
jgi:hypothetical protein